jgi:RNA polymerase sigma-70 factor (ECF subfamily)
MKRSCQADFRSVATAPTHRVVNLLQASGPPKSEIMSHERERFQGDVADSNVGIAWIERLRLGRTDALDTLLAVYWQPLLDYANTILRNPDAAQDVVQQAFIRLWQGRRDWRTGSSARSLLFTIVRNIALNERRSQRMHERWVRSNSTAPAGPPPPDQVFDHNELSEAVVRAIEGLPLRRREVFTLARFQGFSYQQIAEVMGISAQTVANQMSLAIAQLRESLSGFLRDSAVGRSPGSREAPGVRDAVAPRSPGTGDW